MLDEKTRSIGFLQLNRRVFWSPIDLGKLFSYLRGGCWFRKSYQPCRFQSPQMSFSACSTFKIWKRSSETSAMEVEDASKHLRLPHWATVCIVSNCPRNKLAQDVILSIQNILSKSRSQNSIASVVSGQTQDLVSSLKRRELFLKEALYWVLLEISREVWSAYCCVSFHSMRWPEIHRKDDPAFDTWDSKGYHSHIRIIVCLHIWNAGATSRFQVRIFPKNLITLA